jgi:hypothetical protein
MSKQDQANILNMLQEGKITVEEAQSLLEALKSPQEFSIQQKKSSSRKMLKVLIKSKDGDDVKVQVPVEFTKFLKMGNASEKLDAYDIDVDELIKLIEEGANGEIVDIKTADGDLVKVVVE